MESEKWDGRSIRIGIRGTRGQTTEKYDIYIRQKVFNSPLNGKSCKLDKKPNSENGKRQTAGGSTFFYILHFTNFTMIYVIYIIIYK